MNLLFNGLSLSSIILLASLGLAITFGLMRVINMAHGEFMMIGAYTSYVVQNLLQTWLGNSGADVGYFLSIIIAFAVTFLIGSLLETLVVSRLQQAARTIFGTQGVLVTTPKVLSGSIRIGKASLSMTRLFIIALVACCLLLVWFLMYRTNFGRQMRAVMQNRSMAQCMGINSRKIDNLTFSIGSGLAGIAGCSIALLGSIDSTVGQNYIVNTFMAVVLGGVGTFPYHKHRGRNISRVPDLRFRYIPRSDPVRSPRWQMPCIFQETTLWCFLQIRSVTAGASKPVQSQ
mgnify:CR=1 FL=1